MNTLSLSLSNAKKQINSLDAELLACHVFHLTRTQLITNEEKKYSESIINNFKQLVNKRKNGVSLSEILGIKEFYGLEFIVSNDVLTPRPETEWLVEWAIEKIDEKQSVQKLLSSFSRLNPKITNHQKNIKIIDIGQGSGCIGMSIAKNVLHVSNQSKNISFLSTDISKKAIAIAKENAKKHDLLDKIMFKQSDLLQNISIDEIKNSIIVTNLPYIPEGDISFMSTEVLQGDPKLALFSGEKGTDLYIQLFNNLSKPEYNTFYAIAFEFDPPQKEFFTQYLSGIFPKRNISFYPDLSGKIRFGEII